jgi:hypothetical protein
MGGERKHPETKRPGLKGDTLKERLQRYIVKDKRTGCWIWTGPGRGGGDYGSSTWRGRKYRAHRAAWEIWRGRIPRGKFVCHRCDQPWCVRPHHLFLGTHTDNMRDCIAKGRWGGAGNAVAWAKSRTPEYWASRKRRRGTFIK